MSVGVRIVRAHLLARRHLRLQLLRKRRGDVETVVARRLGVGYVGGDRLLPKGRRVEKLPRQLVIVGLEDRVRS
jgi:hypothetical protein